MEIITGSVFEKIKKSILGSKSDLVVFTSLDDDLNRRVMEKLKIDILLISHVGRKDFSKQRNSGLNHVLANIAKKNNIKIGINLDEIIEMSSFELSEVISRIRQNIVLCSKSKVAMKFVFSKSFNERNVYSLKSLGLVLGMPTWMIKGL